MSCETWPRSPEMAVQGANGNGMDGMVWGGRKPFEKRSKKRWGWGVKGKLLRVV